jgi:undecaprenyl diphosphate synthase
MHQDIIQTIKLGSIPEHVAMIMDGNGRWAKKNGFLRVIGHKNGVRTVREVVEASAELGIRVLTLYAFSTENWNRPKREVNTIMEIIVNSLKKELPNFLKNNIKLETIGETHLLAESCKKNLLNVIEKTSSNNGLTLVLALGYSSRMEITNMIKHVAKEISDGALKIENIDEKLISQKLYTARYPDPDLLIRTSGEFRISNFLLWQIAYSELYFSTKLWPDFNRDDFFEAILEFQNRERRFGRTTEQIKN